MGSRLNILLSIFVLLLDCLNSCILCPYRIPPVPKPLDHMQIPSAEKLMEMYSGLTQLCENKTSLSTVSSVCREEVTKLVCSFNDLTRSYQSECPSAEDTQECAKCRKMNAKKYAKSSWIQIWLDSIGKMPSGISEGNYFWLGDYEQCERLKISNHFNGRYCLVDFAIPSSVTELVCDHNQALEVSLGACLPASCSTDESTLLTLPSILFTFGVLLETNGQLQPLLLGSNLRKGLPLVGFRALASVWLVLLWLATLAHWWTNTNNFSPLLSDLVLALSLQRNASDSMRTKRDETSSFHAAQGIQVLSVFVLASGYVFFLMMPFLENPMFAYEFSSQFIYQPLMNVSFYVDGLLVLGALRLALKSPEKFATFGDLLKQVFRRFARIWPAYSIVTLFIASVYERLGEGPMWSHNDMTKRCANNWWASLLFINNLIGGEMICLDTGFLIVLEAQLFVFGVILLFFLNRYRKAVLYAALGLCAMSIIYVFVVVYRQHLYATLIPTQNVLDLHSYGIYVNKIYTNPLSRLTPYLLGLITPFLLPRNFPKKLTALFHVAITILCWMLVSLIVWGPYYLVINPAQVWHSLYASLHRFAWASVVLFAVYSLDNSSQKNLRNSMLSWRVFYPLSKITYLVFLISEPVSISLFASLHRPIYLTAGSVILTCVGCVIFSYLVAFLVDIGISRPFRNLLDMCLNRFADSAARIPNQE